ncbi:MAG: hypothetical protein NTZ83_03765 [Candidatus Pacearchaeota archaeon]|nr:hypothetical protein [Candidatus Pacearchaeota archaeon]
MNKNPIQLENILKAVKVKEKFYEVTASDGKKYLCELLFSWGRSVEGSKPVYIPDEEKEITKKVFISKPDIIHEIDSITGKNNFLADDSIVSTYSLSAYRIERKLD